MPPAIPDTEDLLLPLAMLSCVALVSGSVRSSTRTSVTVGSAPTGPILAIAANNVHVDRHATIFAQGRPCSCMTARSASNRCFRPYHTASAAYPPCSPLAWHRTSEASWMLKRSCDGFARSLMNSGQMSPRSSSWVCQRVDARAPEHEIEPLNNEPLQVICIGRKDLQSPLKSPHACGARIA